MSDSPSRPSVSVLVCVYNGENFLAATLDSALAQTHADLELIAIDDGSTDQSATILSRYSDPRVRVERRLNQGAAAALGAALELARGTYIALLDQDDLWERDYLGAHLDVLTRRPEIDLTFSWYRIINDQGQEIGLRSNRCRGTFDLRGLLRDFVIGASSNAVARRTAIEQAGGIDPALPRYYDMDLFLRVAHLRRHNILAIPRDLMLYRRHDSQISRDLDAMQREWEQLLGKLRLLAPDDVTAVEKHSRSNMSRYFARIAYETDHFQEGLHHLSSGFLSSPAHFVADSRNWLTSAACLCGLLLPPRLHSFFERLAGLQRARR